MDDQLNATMLSAPREASLLSRLWELLLELVGRVASLLSPGRVVSIGPRSVRLTRLIAEGSSGYVWHAMDASGREYAVKEVTTQSGEARARLRRETEAHVAVQSDNVLRLLDCSFSASGGEEGAGKGFLLFPLLGPSIQDVINQCAAAGKGGSPATFAFFSEAAVLKLAIGLSRGLQALHAAGSVHRDLCPRNVLLREVPLHRPPPSPEPVICDLGSVAPLRVVVATRADASRLIDEACEFSSPPYRAPELWDCDPDTVVGAPADVWALGCTLFAAAFGYSPFECVRSDADGRLRLCDPSHVRVLAPVAFPSAHPFSQPFCELLLACTRAQASMRPSLAEVARTAAALQGVVHLQVE
jgi:serine/threonine kinase 16